MQEIVSNLVLANSELLELDFWGSWKLLFCISFLPWAVSSLQPGFISFIIHFLYSLCFPAFCSHYLLTSHIVIDCFLWPTFLDICARKSHNLHMFVLSVSGSEKIANELPWLQVCASVCLELCTKTINSLINTLVFLDVASMEHWDCRAC